jgi:HEPN domain-containing protein
MDELIKRIAQKLNVSEEMSQSAIEMVLDYLKKKLPAPLAGQLDAFLANDQTLEQAEELVKGLEGLLGGLGKS